MSKASELEAARLAAERTDTRCESIIQELAATREDPTQLIEDLARLMLAEATYISEQRKSAWQSRSKEHTAAGRILEQWAADLAAYLERDKPPMRLPLDEIPRPTRHADLDPADGPISAQIASKLLDGPVTPNVARSIRESIEAEPTIDTKLDAAFGPSRPLTRDEIDDQWPDAPPDVVHVTALDDRWAWCERKGGRRAYRPGANCPECIRLFDSATRDDHSPPADTTFGVSNDTVLGAALGFIKDDVDAMGRPEAMAGIKFPVLEPIDDKLTRHQDGSYTGVAQFIVQPDAPKVLTINIHGSRFFTGTEMPGRSGILHVSYQIHESSLIEITGQDFRPDPPMPMLDTIDPFGIPAMVEPSPPPVRQTQQRMTFDAIREHGMARAQGADHRSYSQASSFAECGIRYALGDLETPAWWNVGGTALHYACEWLNRETFMAQNATADPTYTLPDATGHVIETLWTNCLNRALSEAIAEHPTVSPDRWRAAKKGAEGYDWWRTNGVDMVRRWIARLAWLYDQGWTIATLDGKPAIEYDAPMWINVPTAQGRRIKVDNILDLVMVRDDTFLIVDFKSGASAPDSTAQLGQYAHALAQVLTDKELIFGAYWLARTDELRRAGAPTEAHESIDLRDLHPWEGIEYLITTMHTAESQGLYLPNRTRWCVSCGVRGLCPVGPS